MGAELSPMPLPLLLLPLLYAPLRLIDQEHTHPSISHNQVMEPRNPPLPTLLPTTNHSTRA